MNLKRRLQPWFEQGWASMLARSATRCLKRAMVPVARLAWSRFAPDALVKPDLESSYDPDGAGARDPHDPPGERRFAFAAPREHFTGSKRGPRRHGLICRFAAGPDEPQPSWPRRTSVWRKATILLGEQGGLRSRFANERRVNHG
jgi:hypothetical protein